MESAGHSRLLKYLLPSSQIHTSKMSEPHSYKVKFDYKNPENIDAEVPNEQKLRENEEIVIFQEDTFAPVITLKKEEAVFTKGDMKLQKVSVTENISGNKNGGMYIVINPMYSTITGEVITGPQPLRQINGNIQVSTELDKKPKEEKKSRTRIPKVKQTVEKVQKQKREDERREENEVPPTQVSQKRRSSIPRLKGRKTASTVREPVNKNDENVNNLETVTKINNENANNTETNVETKPEDEFDKIYEQIFDDQQTGAINDILIDSIEDPDTLETSFEEIIHSYEEKPVVKSKIPLLKQKSLHDIKLPRKFDRRYSLKNGAIVGDNTVDNPLKVKEDLRPIESTVDVSQDIKDDTISESKEVISNSEIIDAKVTNNDIKETVKVATPSFVNIVNNDNREQHFIKPESVNSTNSDNNFEQNVEIPDSTKMVLNVQSVTRTKDNPIEEIKKNTPEENEGYEIRKELAVLRERLSKRIKKFDSMEPITDSQKVSIPKRSTSQIDQRVLKETKDEPFEKVKTEFDTKYYKPDSFIDVQNNIEEGLDNPERIKTVINIKHNKIEQSIDIEDKTEMGPIIEIKEKQTKDVPVHIKDKSTEIPYKTNKILTSDDLKLKKGVDKDKNEHSPVLRGNVSKIINRLVSNDGVEVHNEKKDHVEPLPVKKSVSSRIAMFERQGSETTSSKIETKIPKPRPRANVQKPRIVDELLKSQGNVDSKVNTTYEEIPITTDPVFDENLKAINNIENELNNLKGDVFVTKERIEASCEIKDIITEENNNEYIKIITKNNEEREFKIDDEVIESNLNNDIELLNNDFKPTDNKEQINLQSNNETFELQAKKHETLKNEFKPKDNKVQNELNTIHNSKEKINGAFTKTPTLTIEDRLKRMTSPKEEEMKRSKSVAELDIGDAVKGKVHRMIVRINSIEKIELEKKEINAKERPRKRSVSEKIALFEIINDRGKRTNIKEIDSKLYIHRKMGFPMARPQYPWIAKMLEYLKDEEGDKWLKKKLTPVKMEETTTTTEKITKIDKKSKALEPTVSDEVFNEKIAELTNAKTKYGRMDDMIYLKLRNGAEMPVLGIGTALLHPRLLHHVIGAAIDLGYRAFDTAYIYGNEKEVGQAIKAKIDDGTVRREDLFISSKLWSTFHRQDLVETACRSSLEAMGLEYFDLFMIHNPMSFLEDGDPIPTIANVIQYSTSDYLDAWFGMEELVTKGLARSIGVSNFNSEQVARVTEKARVKPVINQVECHPYLTQERLDEFCGERDIKLNCFGVLGSKGTPDEYKSNLLPVIEDPLIKCMAAGLKVTPAQLLLRYQIERGHSAVIKSSSASHLWENLQSLTMTLAQIQVDALNALNRNKRTYAFKGMGDTHKNYPFKIPF